MNVYFAADHAGFELKNYLLNIVRGELSHHVEDCGAAQYDASDDYPEIIAIACEKLSEDVARNIAARAIVIGKSGTGEAITANKFRGIRAVQYSGGSSEIITLSRTHNDANVLSLGSAFVRRSEAAEAVRIWLATQFGGEERHVRRISQIRTLEAESFT